MARIHFDFGSLTLDAGLLDTPTHSAAGLDLAAVQNKLEHAKNDSSEHAGLNTPALTTPCRPGNWEDEIAPAGRCAARLYLGCACGVAV